MLSELAMPRGIESATIPVAGAEPLRTVTLANGRGTRVRLCELGASLLSVETTDRYGHRDNILLSYADPQHWLENDWYLGVAVGRVANRIGGARFRIGETEYRLPANDGANHLHGGPDGLSGKRWQMVQSESGAAGQSVTFRSESPEGEGGYPGRLSVELTYRLGEDDTLALEYRATTDKATPVALTNHCYWNLAGRDGILEHELEIHAEKLLALNSELVPTGELLDVEGTPVDFRKRKKIGRDIDAWPGGYDNFWVVDENAEKILKPIAELTHPASGRSVKIVSSEAGVQFYSGNFLDGSRNREDGSPIQQYAGLCLETHGFPDAPNHDNFPSVILQPGEEYRQTTIYSFSAE
ncbi:aldose epimerase family protein [Microbulbifer halophilus]|uniref:Aldose 1-epimerase n=1 Tax=Microbulbifer halophilus TaxID=453963 RepID=A0ABW5EBQ9_9GAMM|nr:aldose epimerase family protein [Microbulbifer halophilus]MCW8126560.1 galactose mutarotase [Microbulbifer halophilus]